MELKIEGMSCQHCVAAVTKALLAVPGVTKAEVDLAGKRAAVEGAAAKEDLVKVVEKAGFEAS